MGDLVAPVESLAIEISQGSEGTRCEKAAASILNGALHAALFIAPRRAAGPGGEGVVGREFQEAGMEVDGIGAALHPNPGRRERGRGENSRGSGRRRIPATGRGCRRG